MSEANAGASDPVDTASADSVVSYTRVVAVEFALAEPKRLTAVSTALK